MGSRNGHNLNSETMHFARLGLPDPAGQLHPASRCHLIWKLTLKKSLQSFGKYAIGQGRRMTISSDPLIDRGCTRV